MLSPFRGSSSFHGNDVHVDHNTLVVLLFSIALGENAREKTLSCELCDIAGCHNVKDSLRCH